MYRETNEAGSYSETNRKPEGPALEYRPGASGVATDAAVSAATKRQGPAAFRLFNRRALIGSTVVLALMGGSAAGLHWWLSGRYIVSTDDAYVRAHNTTLASKISGYVASIPIEDNTPVRAGDVIATIDDGDYRLAVDAARGKVATEEATVDRIGRQITAQAATVDQTKAQLLSAQADAKKTQLEFERQQTLSAQKFASQQQFEQAEASRDQAAASVASAQAVIAAATANLDVLKAQQKEAARTLDELQTAQAKAERDLSFAVIRAPVDGVFSNRGVQTGDYVQTGQRVASSRAASRRLYRGQFQGDATRASDARPACLDQHRCAPGAHDQRHGGKSRAGLGRRVLAAAAG